MQKLLFPVVILRCILSIRYYISYDFYEVLLIKLSIIQYSYGYCQEYCWLYQLHFFYKQPVYKQLALEWQITKQLSGLNPISLSNNKNCR